MTAAMISARGAMPTNVLLSEVAISRARVGGRPLLLQHLEQAWQGMCRVLKSQLLLGNAVAVSPKTCTFFVTFKTAAQNGRTKYALRIPNVAFHPQFATTYTMDSGVPRDPVGLDILRMPLELVAGEARLPADVVSECLRETFLFVGESIFQGRLVMLEFAGVGTLLVKRDRVNMHFGEAFLDELFAIDTRKWPAAAREAGELIRPRPLESRPLSRTSSSARPRSASSQGRPASSAAAATVDSTPRPTFVPGAAGGRTFADLEAERVRVRALQQKIVEKRAQPRKPLVALTKAVNGAATSAKGPSDLEPHLLLGDAEEEESIYSIMTPNRHRDVMSLLPPQQQQHQQPQPGDHVEEYLSPASVYDGNGTMISDVAVSEQLEPVTAIPVVATTQRPAPTPISSQRQGFNIFASESQPIYHEPIRGRKRVVDDRSQGLRASDVMSSWAPEQATATVRASSAVGARR